MIVQENGIFWLETNNTSYLFEVNKAGILEHLYYGGRIQRGDAEHLRMKRQYEPGNTILLDPAYPGLSLEDAMLEMSSYGKGDIREPFIDVTHKDGSNTSDFRFSDFYIDNEKKEMETLPGSYGATEHLCVTLMDEQYDLTLELHYYVYSRVDVITRTAKLMNTSGEEICVNRLLSNQLDLPTDEYTVTSFTGAWIREMERHDTRLENGKFVISSYAGVSSNRANPFTMLSKEDTSEDHGECYGFNLIYSGNHYTSYEVSGFGKTRMVSGINPQTFLFLLAPGEALEAPEAIMSYSEKGFNGLSQNFHHFIKEHILRGYWKDRERPVLLNSWEACYFDINEDKIVNLARKAAEVGIELVVMDDGWFGRRDDDTTSLGDWTVNAEKLPNGLKGLADKVNAEGVDFGIWVEPEMISVESRLYREHPQWVLQIPGKPHSEGRNQRILDMGCKEVQDYVIDSLSAIFDSANIAYCKWDMNRDFSDYFSQNLDASHQQELMHRYQIGLYHCMKVLTEKYPKILFEGCASGGNRYDLGILCYFPQIWTSDNTDALARSQIQNNVSYGYPPASFTCHVSAVPSHQTMRSTPLETRYHIAAFGCLGYEFDLCKLPQEELERVAEQVVLYKKYRCLFQYGDFYRVRNDSRILEWNVVSPDKKEAMGVLFQKFIRPNWSHDSFKAKGLCPDMCYRFTNRFQEMDAGDAEEEDYVVSGLGLMKAGVMLQQAFAGTGFNSQMRRFWDFASRLYVMREVEK